MGQLETEQKPFQKYSEKDKYWDPVLLQLKNICKTTGLLYDEAKLKEQVPFVFLF